jgi:hypothetical protein
MIFNKSPEPTTVGVVRSAFLLLAVSLLTLTGCSTTHPSVGAKADSEMVLVTYHVQSGKEMEFQAVLAHAWKVYRSEHMVFYKPHVLFQDVEDGDKIRFVEIFTWVKKPDNAPDNVQAIWKQEHSLCEARNGHAEIEGGEVKLITGR